MTINFYFIGLMPLYLPFNTEDALTFVTN